jgi:hypothetical protein
MLREVIPRAGGPFALLVLLISLAVHAYTFVPSAKIGFGAWIIPFHIGAIIAFGMFVFDFAAPRNGRKIFGSKSWLEQLSIHALDDWTDMLRALLATPPWAIGLFLVLAAFVFSTFVSLRPGEGVPTIENGTPFMNNHGVKTPISMDDYWRLSRADLRGFAGGWILASSIPMLYFYFTRPRLLRARAESIIKD